MVISEYTSMMPFFFFFFLKSTGLISTILFCALSGINQQTSMGEQKIFVECIQILLKLFLWEIFKLI